MTVPVRTAPKTPLALREPRRKATNPMRLLKTNPRRSETRSDIAVVAHARTERTIETAANQRRN
jgi:hypothetical protein